MEDYLKSFYGQLRKFIIIERSFFLCSLNFQRFLIKTREMFHVDISRSKGLEIAYFDCNHCIIRDVKLFSSLRRHEDKEAITITDNSIQHIKKEKTVVIMTEVQSLSVLCSWFKEESSMCGECGGLR